MITMGRGPSHADDQLGAALYSERRRAEIMQNYLRRQTGGIRYKGTNVYNGYKQGTTISKIDRSQNPISSIPRDSEWYEQWVQVSITHSASPNTLAARQVFDLDSLLTGRITDDTTVVYDKLQLIGVLTSGAGVYPQDWHFMTIKGLSTNTFTSQNTSPADGFIANEKAITSGGTETKRFQVESTIPRRDGGTWYQDGRFQIDLTKKINQFIRENETAISQGRSLGKFELWVQTNGTNAGTSTINFKLVEAFHTRRRTVNL